MCSSETFEEVLIFFSPPIRERQKIKNIYIYIKQQQQKKNKKMLGVVQNDIDQLKSLSSLDLNWVSQSRHFRWLSNEVSRN